MRAGLAVLDQPFQITYINEHTTINPYGGDFSVRDHVLHCFLRPAHIVAACSTVKSLGTLLPTTSPERSAFICAATRVANVRMKTSKFNS